MPTHSIAAAREWRAEHCRRPDRLGIEHDLAE
jgi:hypothetical protein